MAYKLDVQLILALGVWYIHEMGLDIANENPLNTSVIEKKRSINITFQYIQPCLPFICKLYRGINIINGYFKMHHNSSTKWPSRDNCAWLPLFNSVCVMLVDQKFVSLPLRKRYTDTSYKLNFVYRIWDNWLNFVGDSSIIIICNINIGKCLSLQEWAMTCRWLG